MTPKLPTELREAVSRKPGMPLTIEDDQTHLRYVLLPYDLFHQMEAFFSTHDFTVSDTYQSQSAVAGAMGWDDPAMDVYNDYPISHSAL